MNKAKQTLLSICIPTYNRSSILKETLGKIVSQVEVLGQSAGVEILISDNCSPDETSQVVSQFQKRIPITYIRNTENIGPDRNFIQCFKNAVGKYIWLLGDDDPIESNAISKVLKIAGSDNYGLIHLDRTGNRCNQQFDDTNAFLSNVSYWITYVSANIFRSSIVKDLPVTDKLLHSFLLQVPYYLTSATSTQKNYLIGDKILGTPYAFGTNGGYNLFRVFAHNHLSFWKDFLEKKKISKQCFEQVKKDTFENFLFIYIYTLLICRKNLKRKNERQRLKGGFYIDDAWHILFNVYKRNSYFWFSFFRIPFMLLKTVRKRIENLVGR